MRNLVLAAPGRDPLVQIREARANLGTSTLWGRTDLQRVDADGVQVHLVRDASGAWNLPPTSPSSRPSSPLSLRLGSVAVRNADVFVEDEVTDARVRAGALTLDLQGAGATTRGTAVVTTPVEWALGEREGRLDVSPVQLSFDGRDLAAESLRVKGPEGLVEVGGRLRNVTGAGSFDLDVRAETDLARLPLDGAASRRGSVTVSGRVEGPFAAPVAQVSVSGRGVVWGSVQGATVDARLRADPKAVSVESAKAHVAGGSVSVHGQVALDAKEKSRLEAKWEGLGGDALRLYGVEGTLAGQAVATGRGPSLAGLGLMAEIVASRGSRRARRRPLSGRSELTVRDGAWSLVADHTAGSGARVSGQAGGRFVESDPMASTLSGDVRADVQDMAPLAPGGRQ